jgi:enolase-phosphatase E1
VNPPDESQVRVLLLDIEGTTTPMDFVYKTLFPFASRKLKAFLCEHAWEPETAALLQELRSQCKKESQDLRPPAWSDEGKDAWLQSCVAYCQWLIEKDSKCTPLKTLEGKIWLEGFASGELRGEVYPDVPKAFERWRRQKRIICIYSSGSVLAQQQLFRTTTIGDLTPHISVFFDTRVGAKANSESYKKIVQSFSYKAERFLFISDVVKEIEAARAAGMQALLCVRQEQTAQEHGQSRVIHSFNEVFPD